MKRRMRLGFKGFGGGRPGEEYDGVGVLYIGTERRVHKGAGGFVVLDMNTGRGS